MKRRDFLLNSTAAAAAFAAPSTPATATVLYNDHATKLDKSGPASTIHTTFGYAPPISRASMSSS